MAASHDLDVVIVGSGVAGLSAAIAAHEQGCRRILVAESEHVVGGASRLSGGIMMGSGTRLQKAQQIDDSPDHMFHEYLLMNRYDVDAGPARRFVDEAGPTIDWLEAQGVRFLPYVFVAGNEAIPHSHWVEGNGEGLMAALHARCRELGIDIALGRRVDRILAGPDGVRGVAVGDDEITAAVTIVATGGFCANPSRFADLWPDALAGGDWNYYIAGDGAPGSRGDGIDLGRAVGAQVTGHNRGLRLLHTGFHHDFDAAPPGWLVLVGPDARRFVAETAHYGVLDDIVKTRGNVAWAILDDRLLRTPGIPASKYDPEGKSRPVNYNPDIIDAMVAEGRAWRADTIEDLAAQLGLDPATLAATIRRYNASVAQGVDRDFLKYPEYMQPISTAPYYGVKLKPASLAVSACGLRIDADAQVLDGSGEPIPGLLAAGECTGGVIGPFYAGSGNSLTNGATFGRIAGTTAARRALALAAQ